MAQNNETSHYYSVGGRVCFGEPLENAVRREVFEETNVDMEIDRLAYIHENFFLWGHEQIPFHEIAFFYLMKFNEEIRNQPFRAVKEPYGNVSLDWIPIGNLDDMHLYPEFFKTEICHLRSNAVNSVRHFITKDGVTRRLR
jgi:ADP-ribose pyrophosphatase YjhB (NUDIX family)